MASYLDAVYNAPLPSAILIYDLWIYFSIRNELLCLIVGPCDLLQMSPSQMSGRVHGIASLSQDPTSSRLIATCTDSKYVNEYQK